MFKFITVKKEDRIFEITLNRPEKRNALSGELVIELKSAFVAAEADTATKVILLKATGDVFSAGADLDYLKQLQNNSYYENFADSSSLAELFHIIYKNKKVVIAQVEGHAIAGGCGLATVADFTFATPAVNMGYTEVKIGFIPAIVSIFLIRKIGEQKAKDLLLTGRLITSEYAERIGLINEVVEKEEIGDFVQKFAHRLINETSENSLALTKEMIAKVQEISIAEVLHYGAEMNARCRAEESCKRGINAFLNKEKIMW